MSELQTSLNIYFLGGVLLLVILGYIPFILRLRKVKKSLAQTITISDLIKSHTPCEYILFWDGDHQDNYLVSPTFDETMKWRENLQTYDDLKELFIQKKIDHILEKIETLFEKKEEFDEEAKIGKKSYQIVGAFNKKENSDSFYSLIFYDLTEQKQLEEKYNLLQTSTKRIKKFLHQLPFPVWLRKKNLDIIECNKAYIKAVEKETVREVVKNQIELAPKSIDDSGKAVASSALEKRDIYSEQHHVVMDGSRRLVEITEIPLKKNWQEDDEEHLVIGGYAFDRTDIEEIEKQLDRHTKAQAEILENLGTPMAIFGEDQRLVFYNQAYIDLWQFEERILNAKPNYGEILEMKREKRLFPEIVDFPGYKKTQLNYFTTLIDTYEEILHLPNGKAIRRILTPHPLGGILFTYEDVTDALTLQRSYNTLVEVERETLNNLYEGVAVFGSDGMLKLTNPSFQKMWKIEEKDLHIELHIQEFFDLLGERFKNKGNIDKHRNRYIKAIGERSSEMGRIDCKDGTIIDYATMPLPDGNVLFSFIDMTDSIRAERALIERNEALMTADRLKTEFLANISYELRTPLNTVLGFAEVLKAEYFGELNNKQTEYIDLILSSSNRLIVLINDILDLALVEAGHFSLEKKSIDVYDMLESIMNLSRESARQHNLKLSLQCNKDIGFVNADERRIKQVLFNIVSNAIKFTPSGGAVTINADQSNNKLYLEITDTGIGIPEEDQKRIFEKFEKGKRKRRIAGAGLGLSLVKSVIELHGGNVQIESKPNKGTTVTCILPNKISKLENKQVNKANVTG